MKWFLIFVFNIAFSIMIGLIYNIVPAWGYSVAYIGGGLSLGASVLMFSLMDNRRR